MERIPVDLSGVPETLLGNLARRAAAARARRPLLRDSRAVELVERLDYDFNAVSGGVAWHAVRVATFDAAVSRFLLERPRGTVAALGEGLETQFWRVDNGLVHWVTVDLPETLALRRKVLPEGDRQRSHAGSALALDWLDSAESASPLLVTAQGLLPYFDAGQVHGLIAGIAARRPGTRIVFDVVPDTMLELAKRSAGRESQLATELWTWTFNPAERAAISAIPGVRALRDLRPPAALGLAPCLLAAVRLLPRRLRYSLPVLPVLEALTGPG